MQEYNNEKIVALTMKVVSFDVRALRSAISKYLRYREKQIKPKVIHGKLPLKKLIRGNDNASVTNIEITDQNIKAFEKTARKYGIDYSLKKDSSTEPPKYTIFFRAKDSEIMTAAFKDFLNSESRKKEKKPLVLKRLNSLVRLKNKELTREKTKTREAEL